MRLLGCLLTAATLVLAGCGEDSSSAAKTPPVVEAAAEKPPGNRLINEKSPYLLQHAHNPVDWYPWGDEAFERAEKEGKPIFLSIGYSTCHWCHVMERESFEDEEIAALMNEHFINIKVDREERPDVDRVYMLATQALTGQGGWPMSVFLTHDRKPFFAGTYFPPRSEGGRPGFRELIDIINKSWTTDREKVLASADHITGLLKEHTSATGDAGELSTSMLDTARAEMVKAYDSKHAGFGEGQKFPQPSRLLFLLREHARTGDKQARTIVDDTLKAMASGGIRDQLGGGFHRYSVDRQWRVPHFEKMLYDQAQLVSAYVEAWQVTGNAEFQAVARETLDYVLREMRHANGGFFSAQDADSPKLDNPKEKGEGVFFTWTAAEIDKLLGEDAALFRHAYGVEAKGNAPSDPHGEFGGLNILYRAHNDAAVAKKFDQPVGEVASALASSRKTLMAARAKRPIPHLDDKVLVSWNGMMISGFAKAALAFDEPRYAAAAAAAAGFIEKQLWNAKDGALLRRWREGEAAIPGQLEDYAFLVQGLLDLYEADFNHHWLQWAEQLTDRSVELLWDDAGGGFHEVQDDSSDLPVAMKDRHDGATPAANSVAALNLQRLSDITGRKELAAKAGALLESSGSVLAQAPSAAPQLLMALDHRLAPKRQVIIAGEAGADDTSALLDEVRSRYIPDRTLLLADGSKGQLWLQGRQPVFEFIQPLEGRATAYVCQDYVCKKPTTDPAVMREQLGTGTGLSGSIKSAGPD